MYDWKIGVIEDGLDQHAYISEDVGLHPEARFTYRPVTPEEFESFDDKINKELPGRARALVGVLLSQKIKAWSLLDSKGAPTTINELSCRRLRASLQMKIYQIIAGVRPTDIDPKLGAGTASEDFKTLEELAGFEGKLGN